MRRLGPDDVVEVAKRLDACHWSWTIEELGSVLQTLGVTVLDPLDNTSVRIEHPDLPGVFGFAVNLIDESMVLEISVTATEVIDSNDQTAIAALSTAYEECFAALEAAFGEPDDPSAEYGAVWDRGEEVMELRDLTIALALVRISKRSRQIRQGG